mmetsp:Transcript_11019/g.1709  ORF Transcript_11019/g.1709 Transcript_11019/m.1709 type:complete len:87 (+) Transcript_11019:133-393(+)
MQFKNLHEVNSFGALFVPVYCLPLAMFVNRLVLGNAKRGHSGYRHQWTMLSVTWPLACWFGFTLPIPRKLYTSVIASDNSDGEYVR